MAIPVSNPPPKYEPPPPSAPEPPLAPMGPGGPPRGIDPRARGCVIALGVAGALVCVASLAIALSCRGCMELGEAQAVRQISAGYRAASIQLDHETEHASDLRELEQLGDAGGVSLIAFGILNNRYNDAITNDGRIDADELHLGMELVHDIVLGNGSVDLNHYPAGR